MRKWKINHYVERSPIFARWKEASPPLSLAHLYSTGEEAGGRPGARREGGCNDASGKERAQLLDQERRKERKIPQIGDIETVVREGWQRR